MYQATLNYSKSLIQHAVFGFWRRTLGLPFLIMLGIVIVYLAYVIFCGDRTWLTGLLSGVAIVACVLMVTLYVSHYRNSWRKLKAMGMPQATLTVSESTVALASGAGSSTLPWSSIAEVWQFKQCWLLLFSKSQFVTLPLADLTPDIRSFILVQVKSAGGKVS